MLNKKGFGITQALMLSAMVALVGTTLMVTSQNMTNVTATADIRAEANSDAFIVQSLLSDEKTCTANMAGFAVPENENKLKEFDNNRGKLYAVRNNGTLSDSLLIPSQNSANKEIRVKAADLFVKRDPASASRVILQVGYKSKDHILGGDILKREVPLYVSYAGNDKTIRRCSSDPLIPDEQDGGGRDQGDNPCNTLPPNPSNADGMANNGPPPQLTQEIADGVIDQICNDQKYPVTSGLLIRKGEINDCFSADDQPKNARCAMILDLAFGESMGGNRTKVDDHVIAKNRSGYARKEDCKKQKLYSEGDVVTREGNEKLSTVKPKDYKPGKTYVTKQSLSQYVCMGGNWKRIERRPAETTTGAVEVVDYDCLGAVCDHSCFIPDTLITMQDGSLKAISQVNAGEYVRGQRGSNLVIGVEKVPLGGRKLFSINRGKAFVTAEHPFMTPQGWKSFSPKATARENPNLRIEGRLGVGDKVLHQGRWIEIKSVEVKDKSKSVPWVYNLLLDGDHTYVADGYLVHNKGADGDAGGSGSGSGSGGAGSAGVGGTGGTGGVGSAGI